MIFREEDLLNKIIAAPNGSELKIFVYIALKQPAEGILGFETTKEQLAIDLNLKIRTVFTALHWLKNNLLIQELKLFDTVDFMVNPRFVMNNSDYQDRLNEWNRRCRLDIAREIRIKKEKRRRELKIAKKNA
ncbi:MAG: hypothetical protein II857_00890 [Selenomonadaceae bacterium]|nr:hypothetical protein [Selenomonadaceae bacterium]